MPKQRVGVVGAQAAFVFDDAYAEVALAMIDAAKQRCAASVFIVDPDPDEDAGLLVDSLLLALAAATWRGVSVQLIVGGSLVNVRIRSACLLAMRRAAQLGIDCRLGAVQQARSDHAKVLVADDKVLLGSHNWSPGALTDQTQDSVIIHDAALASHHHSRFAQRWADIGEGSDDVAL